MARDDTTTTDQAPSVQNTGQPRPGIVLVVANATPTLKVVPYDRGPTVVGRGEDATIIVDDKRQSRKHAEFTRDARGWIVRDLGSHNGTKVDGNRIETGVPTRGAVVRIGESLLLLEEDIRRFGQPHAIFGTTRVVGPTLQAVLDLVAQAARDGLHVLVQGETGVGKELVAHSFHESSPRPTGPFGTINCAAFAETLLEDELFGHVRGAFSGATTERVGLLEANNNGTVFLDEIGDMSLAVQAKVLRALQDGEIRRLGENRSRRIRVQVVSATKWPLRERVASGAFRDDLYYRLAQLVVEVPPLRARPEEVPFLVAHALRGAGEVTAGASLYEQCLLRPWPGNVRELLSAIQGAATVAKTARETRVVASHLQPLAGLPASTTLPTPSQGLRSPLKREEKEEAVLAAYRETHDAATVAVRTGVSVATVYRYLKKHGLGTD